MDPSLANSNLDPPKERVLARGLLPALAVNLMLMSALALGFDWKFGDDAVQAPAASLAAPSSDANDTARMGGAPTPPSEAPVPAWPTAAATGPITARDIPKQVVASATREQAAPAPSKRTEPVAAKPVQARRDVHVAKVEPRARPAPKPVETKADDGVQPSFDCSKARSVPERLVCADPELTRLDRDLGRVHARARRVTTDPQDFKRESDDEWRLREAVCRDRDCLLEWYSHRKQQLEERIAQGR
jgi:hypothetical protein